MSLGPGASAELGRWGRPRDFEVEMGPEAVEGGASGYGGGETAEGGNHLGGTQVLGANDEENRLREVQEREPWSCSHTEPREGRVNPCRGDLSEGLLGYSTDIL